MRASRPIRVLAWTRLQGLARTPTSVGVFLCAELARTEPCQELARTGTPRLPGQLCTGTLGRAMLGILKKREDTSMGYTNYWEHRGFTVEEWSALRNVTQGLILPSAREAGIPLVFESDIPEAPEVTKDLIRFNGQDDAGYETFYLTKAPTHFAFCKTGRQPYDAAVIAVLLSAAVINKSFTWHSDGDNEPGFMDAGKALLVGSTV